ncbi:urea ABC transporter substrate-binding protein [Streptomyces sp. T-3]|nr:urea ABC transporter substrate-binding protein [Streptomyces sp. T-3]
MKLAGRAALAVATALSCLLSLTACEPDGLGSPLKVGVLHSLTGSVAIAERPIKDATLMAIEEVNRSGGLLGRRLEPVVVDGRSDWPTFAAGAERLISRDKVPVVFGCYTSASRKSVVPVFERHRHLLMYPTFYEGMEASPYVVYTGGTPNQFISPGVKWLLENRGRDIFLIGSDYVFPRASNAFISDQIDYLGGRVVGEEYLPLGSRDVAGAVRRIVAARPSAVLSTLVGDTNVPFFRELRRAGVTPRTIPTLSVVLSESELPSLDPERMAGDHIALNYFQSIRSRANDRFVRGYKRRFGAAQGVADPMEAAYNAVHLWAEAVRKAGSAEPAAVRRAVGGLQFQGPSGRVYVDEENHHAWKTARIGRIRPDGQVDVVWTSEALLRPVPYGVYRTRRQWEDLLQELYLGWGGNWARP